jgi:hypothetical protein
VAGSGQGGAGVPDGAVNRLDLVDVVTWLVLARTSVSPVFSVAKPPRDDSKVFTT